MKLAILDEYEAQASVDLRRWISGYPQFCPEILDFVFWLRRLPPGERTVEAAAGAWRDKDTVVHRLLDRFEQVADWERIACLDHGSFIHSQKSFIHSQKWKEDLEPDRAWAAQVLERRGFEVPNGFACAAIHARAFDALRRDALTESRWRVHLATYLLEWAFELPLFGGSQGERCRRLIELSLRYRNAERIAVSEGWYRVRATDYCVGPHP